MTSSQNIGPQASLLSQWQPGMNRIRNSTHRQTSVRQPGLLRKESMKGEFVIWRLIRTKESIAKRAATQAEM